MISHAKAATAQPTICAAAVKPEAVLAQTVHRIRSCKGRAIRRIDQRRHGRQRKRAGDRLIRNEPAVPTSARCGIDPQATCLYAPAGAGLQSSREGQGSTSNTPPLLITHGERGPAACIPEQLLRQPIPAQQATGGLRQQKKPRRQRDEQRIVPRCNQPRSVRSGAGRSCPPPD